MPDYIFGAITVAVLFFGLGILGYFFVDQDYGPLVGAATGLIASICIAFFVSASNAGFSTACKITIGALLGASLIIGLVMNFVKEEN